MRKGLKPLVEKTMRHLKRIISSNQIALLLYRILIVYLLYFLCRVAFYVYNLDHFRGLGGKELWDVFRGGLLFDSSAIVYTNLLFIFFSLIPLRLRSHRNYQRMLAVIYFVPNGLALAANCIDIPYYDFVLQRTTFDIFSEFRNEAHLAKLTFRIILDYWVTAVFFAALVAIMVWLYRRVKPAPEARIRWQIYYSASLLVFIVAIGLCIGGARGGFRYSTRPITMSNAGEFVSDPDQMALVLNTPFTLIRSVSVPHYSRMSYFASETDLDNVYTPQQRGKTRTPRSLNVVIIIVESLNREFLGSLNRDLDGGHYAGYTPFLDSLVSVGKTWRWSVANGRKSIEALPSILAGIPAVEMPFVLSPHYTNHLESLPRLLQRIGYKTAFFHGAPNGSMGFKAFTRSIGIENYYGATEYGNPADFDGLWGVWDEPFLQFFAHSLDSFPEPFMAALFTVSSHHPFKVPHQYKDKFPKGDFPLQECVGYTDFALRKFFQTASSNPWFASTLFVITADHVSTNQRPEFKNDLGYFSVPIIFYQPGSDLTGLDTLTFAQQIDIMPTVLNYVGFEGDYIAFGKDLFDPQAPNFAFNNLGNSYRLYKDGHFLIYDGRQVSSLYDLRTDSRLTRNLAGQNPALQSDMERYLLAILQQYKNRMVDDELSVKR
jgi:phosphoglycerol transferase MdoB-like AlkP superfamily enzyme